MQQGTGLSFQNKCRKWPFALYAWSGEPERLTPPTCAALRTRIAPSALSEPATVDCMDEGAMALQNPAVAAYFQARDGVSYEDGLRFSTAAVPQPQNWSAFRESVIMPHGSVWLDRAQPAAPITVHGLQCGQPAGRCDLSIWIRPGTTDSAVLGQVIGRNEYGFLIERQLPPPATILDAGGKSCACDKLLLFAPHVTHAARSELRHRVAAVRKPVSQRADCVRGARDRQFCCALQKCGTVRLSLPLLRSTAMLMA
jgi:hypothetical protein